MFLKSLLMIVTSNLVLSSDLQSIYSADKPQLFA